MQNVLLLSKERLLFFGRCIYDTSEGNSIIHAFSCILIHQTIVKVHQEKTSVIIQTHAFLLLMALDIMQRLIQDTPLTCQKRTVQLGHSTLEVGSMEYLLPIRRILSQSKKLSNKTSFKYKWQSFLKFAYSNSLETLPASLNAVMLLLLHLIADS